MNSRQAATWVVVFAVLVLVALRVIDTGSSSSGDTINSGNNDGAGDLHPRSAKVLRAVDGDTIVVRLSDGDIERVRYIGIDTPESVKPNTPVQCFGLKAHDYNQSLVAGKTVRLVPDQEAHDKYGRALAFVYVGDDLINADLVRGGYARTLEIPPNVSKATQFARLERVAIRTRRGLWGSCDR